MRGVVLGAILLAAGAAAATATPQPQPQTQPETGALCAMIEAAAERHALPPEFFARLIWKESRFDIGALSPKGAQGVAQFMPGTALLRGLDDPWDPAQALPASAAYLADLRRRFGNLGLAAAAYNSGEGRVERWLKGASGLPAETRDYVQSITYRPADWFRAPGREVEPRPLAADRPFGEACADLPVMRTRALARAPWAVEIASGLTEPAARRMGRTLRARHAALLAGHPMLVSRNRNRVRGAWSVRVGADSRESARRLCGELRAQSGYCIVLKN